MPLYKTLLENNTSKHGKCKWTVGRWKKHKGDISMCNTGFHCSELIIDAMGYVEPIVIAEVEVRGKSEKQEDKQVWSEMRLIKTYRWTKKDSVSLAIFSAELVIENYEKEYPKNKRPRQAIQAAKKWLTNPTKQNQSAASAALSAALSAASASSALSALSAALSAASAASAALSAALSALSAAWSAAWSAALKDTKQKIETFIRKRLGIK
jgi:hypothetical protein